MMLLRKVPVAMSALGLGLAGLGNLLLPYSPVIRGLCGAAATMVVLLVIARIAVDLEAVRAEFDTPAVLAVLPALFMAIMLLATYLKPYAATPARVLWLVALVVQLVVVVVFLARFLGSFKLAQVLPAWFLVFVGFVVASVTSPAFGMRSFGTVLLYAGILGYLVVLPVIVYRMRVSPLPAPAAPTIAIFAAPPSLCLVGYLAVTEVKQMPIVLALLAVSAVSVAYVFSRLPGILRLPFTPAFAALTFPLVITAIAVKQTSAFLAGSTGLAIPGAVVATMDAVAAGMVLYVLARYLVFLVVPVRETRVAPAPETA